MMRQVKNMALAVLRRPAPHFMTNLLLRLFTGADIALTARIYYPLNVRIGKGARIGRAKLEGHPWRGVTAPTLFVGQGTGVEDGAMLIAMDDILRIGSDCGINPYCVIYSAGPLTIGDHCRIAAHTVIIPENHVFDRTDVPIRSQGSTRKGIVIESDVWLGAGVRVLDGVTIGKGAVIGAGAVVTSDIASYKVAVGVPARAIKNRGEEKE